MNGTELRFTQTMSIDFLNKIQKIKGERMVFSTNGGGTLGHSLFKKMNFSLNLTPYTKTKSK